VPVLDTGARGSTVTFVQKGIGDVLLAWENESYLAINEFGKDKYEIVVPSLSILAEPSVTVVTGNVEKKGAAAVAAANEYLLHLYSEEGQRIAGKNYYRPTDAKIAKEFKFSSLKLVQIDKDFGGWDAATKKHFANDALFDQIFVPKK
jgi:sulfate transport system substrate-binding protein